MTTSARASFSAATISALPSAGSDEGTKLRSGAWLRMKAETPSRSGPRRTMAVSSIT